MERKEYERDFTTAESLAEFRALLATAESHWEIPIRQKPWALKVALRSMLQSATLSLVPVTS